MYVTIDPRNSDPTMLSVTQLINARDKCEWMREFKLEPVIYRRDRVRISYLAFQRLRNMLFEEESERCKNHRILLASAVRFRQVVFEIT